MRRVLAHAKEFSKLLEKNQGIIHKISLLYSHNPADKEDLFQEICLQLWKSYGSFSSDSQFSTWMYRVSLNTAISYTRKRSKVLEREAPDLETQIAAVESQRDERVQVLTEAISRLSKIERAMILLWLEGESYEEIAKIMGITKSNVSVRLVRIKREIGNIISGSGRSS